MLQTKGQMEVDSFVEEYLYCADLDVLEEKWCKLEDEEEVGDKDSDSSHLNLYEIATNWELALSPDSLFEMKCTPCTELSDNDTDYWYDRNDTGIEYENEVGDPDDANADNADADVPNAYITKANDTGIYNVDAAGADKSDDSSSDADNADAGNYDAIPNAEYCVRNDIDDNYGGTETNNPDID